MDLELTLNIIRAALDAASPRPDYARQAAERWLLVQPGHLAISVLLAEAMMASGERRQAERLLHDVLEADPEHQPALRFAIRLYDSQGDTALAWAATASLRQLAPEDPSVQEKLTRMVTTRRPAYAPKLHPGDEADYLELIPALSEMEMSWRARDIDTAATQAAELLGKYPRLVKAHLILGDCLMARGEDAGAVDHIHQAASLDPGGEVVRRLWNGKQPYPEAWPAAEVPGAPGPLPHAVASALGLNLLPAPVGPTGPNGKAAFSSAETADTNSPPAEVPLAPPVSPVQEAWIDIQAEINRLNGRPAGRQQEVTPGPATSKQTRLNPIYVLAANRAGLREKYGSDGWEQIDGALQALAKAAEARLRLPAGVLYIDDATSLSSFDLRPVDPADPWAVKTLLRQMDERLAEQEKEIGFLLLVGGPDLIAFHRLPNPTDDGDLDVLSDNPYGCADDNYFVPQRAVGRLPDGAGPDPTLLLKGISAALAAHHTARRAGRGWLGRWWARMVWRLRGRRLSLGASFGYSASVWRKASLEVFRQIGYPNRLRLSPPLTAAEFSMLAMGPFRYGYFNLHGIADGPAWYGQRDPTFPADYPDFPEALRPGDVEHFGMVPEVVFTEACYGASAVSKSPDTSLCLKFLASGTRMVVGSTCTAYGGLNASLEAADLLAHHFWHGIMAGYSGGRALQQAKVAFAKQMYERQGYLDGEDQKTLISFVHYGDPTLAAPPPGYAAPGKGGKNTWRELTECPPTVCTKQENLEASCQVPEELVNAVRARVANYLPGMEQARLQVNRQRICRGSACERPCGSCQASGKGLVDSAERVVVTLRKAAESAGKVHQLVVKVTVDQMGQMLKLAVSK